MEVGLEGDHELRVGSKRGVFWLTCRLRDVGSDGCSLTTPGAHFLTITLFKARRNFEPTKL